MFLIGIIRHVMLLSYVKLLLVESSYSRGKTCWRSSDIPKGFVMNASAPAASSRDRVDASNWALIATNRTCGFSGRTLANTSMPSNFGRFKSSNTRSKSRRKRTSIALSPSCTTSTMALSASRHCWRTAASLTSSSTIKTRIGCEFSFDTLIAQTFTDIEYTS